ncbi:MAG: T9SS type A sorting domain-containing protein [Paludibacteraceae bacterium]|nr:T9SS type A sorting domain-containing protein [Paludibacteraceae bacterium]MBO7316726.1 T9SS type A sorting domain-containing protein [Paludibacteraceae bacterium]
MRNILLIACFALIAASGHAQSSFISFGSNFIQPNSSQITYSAGQISTNYCSSAVNIAEGIFCITRPENTYSIIIKSNDTSMGIVSSEGGWYTLGQQITFSAIPRDSEKFSFVCWEDGEKTNPRTVNVTADATYIAYFRKNSTTPIESATADDNIKVYTVDERIVIKSDFETDVTVYNIMGNKVAHINAVTSEEINVPKGIYVVKTDKAVHKVIVF